jgi:hypothetical protein
MLSQEKCSVKRLVAFWIAGSLLGIFPIFTTISTGWAQQVVSVNAGTVNYIEGEVFLDGNPVRLPKGTYLRMENGQNLSTKKGRAELLLSSYVHLRLGENSSLRMQDNQLADTRLVLEPGSALIEIVQEVKGNRVRVLAATSIVEIEKAGLYRIDSSPGMLRVYGGEAVAMRGDTKILIKSGKMAHLSGDLASEKYDMDAADPLHQWAAGRSFSLFAVTSDSRKQTHWTPVSMGWVHNSNYRMSYFSEYFRQQWIKDQATRQLEELLAKYRQEQDISQRTIYGAELEELVAKAKEAMRAMKEAEEQARHADPGALQPKPDAGHTKEKSPIVPSRYIAASKIS